MRDLKEQKMNKADLIEYLNKPCSYYIDTNLENLKDLFDRIKEENKIGSKEFDEKYRPIITDELEARYRSKHPGHGGALWGAWYKADDENDPFGSKYAKMLSQKEAAHLADILIYSSAPGEAIGYALNIFAGLSITEVMKARWRDFSVDYEGDYYIQTNVNLPPEEKRTEFDTHPRAIPLIKRLRDVLIRRKEQIESSLTVPIETFWGTAEDVSELPIACLGQDFTSACTIADLSAYARNVLRADLMLEEKRMAYMTKALMETPGLYKFERSAAYFFGRRTYATAIATSIDSAPPHEATVIWLMGHEWPESYGPMPKITKEDILLANQAMESYIKKGNL